MSKFSRKLPNRRKADRIFKCLKTIEAQNLELMLKNILNLEGTQELTANEQKMIIANNVKEVSPRCEAWISEEDCTSYSDRRELWQLN